jgi:hypothetical protein
VAYSWLAGGLRSFTVPALVGVLVPVAVLGAVALSGRAPRRPAPPRLGRSALVWLVPAVAFAALEVANIWIWHSDQAHPSLSVLLDRPLDSHPVRALAFLGWLAAGRELIRR